MKGQEIKNSTLLTHYQGFSREQRFVSHDDGIANEQGLNIPGSMISKPGVLGSSISVILNYNQKPEDLSLPTDSCQPVISDSAANIMDSFDQNSSSSYGNKAVNRHSSSSLSNRSRSSRVSQEKIYKKIHYFWAKKAARKSHQSNEKVRYGCR
jgi:hypothetical protein